MKLEIFTPDKIFFSGEVSSVTFPGIRGAFTMLENHAPIISALDKGKIIFKNGDVEQEINVSTGFIEGHDNVVTVSIEGIENE